jgi:hypothetical protein
MTVLPWNVRTPVAWSVGAERHLGRRHCRPCHRVAEYAPTVLPLAQRALAWPSRAAPQSKDCVRARPAPATIPLRKGRSACGGVLRHGGTFARCGSRHLSTPPPPIRLSPRCAIHPRMRLAWLGRNTSRHPARPPRGACRTRAADSLWPRSSLASPRPLMAPAPSRGARLSARAPYAALCGLCGLCG